MFEILWLEIIDIFKNGKKVFILSVLAFTCACVGINVTLTTYELSKNEEQAAIESYKDKSFYKIVLPGETDVYQRIFSEENFKNIKSAFEQLKTNKMFEYRYNVENLIDFFDIENSNYNENDFPKHANEHLVGYENGTIEHYTDYLTLKAFYVDNEFHKEPNLILSSGKWWNQDDFYVDNPKQIELPVILGSSYQKFYSIGEKIENAHIGTEHAIVLKVEGFFQEGSYFYDNNNTKQIVNRYMIVPAVEVSYDDMIDQEKVDPFALAAYDSFKLINARIVCESKNKNDVKAEVYKILNENGLSEFRLFDETSGWEQRLQINQSQTITSLIISLFMIGMIILMFCIHMYYKVMKNKKKYSVLVLNGIHKKQVFLVVTIETILVFFVSTLLFATMYQIFYNNPSIDLGLSVYTFIVIPFIEIVLLLFIGSYTVHKIYIMDMSSALREKE